MEGSPTTPLPVFLRRYISGLLPTTESLSFTGFKSRRRSSSEGRGSIILILFLKLLSRLG